MKKREKKIRKDVPATVSARNGRTRLIGGEAEYYGFRRDQKNRACAK